MHYVQGTPTIPKLHPGPCKNATSDTQTHRHTVARDQYTFRLGYTSREM